jgi:starch synthase
MGGASYEVALVEHRTAPGARIIFVDHPPSFDRDALYGVGNADYPDNAIRFALLTQAGLRFAASQPRPSVIHAHDWQTSLTPVYLSRGQAAFRPLADVPVVLTIHNLAFQGLFPPETLPAVGLGPDVLTVEGLEYWGRASWLKGGINFSDRITTVSPRYAEEILTTEFGCGFEGILSARRSRLVGILNGIDSEVWDPSRDPWLPATYDARNLAGKRVCKTALLEAFGLPTTAEVLERPLVGMVSRLTDQKGQDLLAAAADDLLALDASFVLIGSGEPRYEELWKALAARVPRRVGARIGFDERTAHLVEAGADMYLMPSRFEPCGLNQMYSMRYGTVPIVRATGGLADTVEDFDPATGRGTGFRFDAYGPVALLAALGRALVAFEHKPTWRKIVRAGMRRNHSWDVSAREYVKVYKDAIRPRAHPAPRRARTR